MPIGVSPETEGMSVICARKVPFYVALTDKNFKKGVQVVTIYPPYNQGVEDKVVEVETLEGNAVLHVANYLSYCVHAAECSGNSEHCIVMTRRRR